MKNRDRCRINKICKRLRLKKYTINEDGTVDVDGIVDISNMKLKKIPLQFGKVTGSFECDANRLTSLKGSPYIVGAHFLCYHNQLKSLDYSPKIVEDDFDCGFNLLTTNYCDSDIRGQFYSTFRDEEGLIFFEDVITNYDGWRKLIRRDKIIKGVLKNGK